MVLSIMEIFTAGITSLVLIVKIIGGAVAAWGAINLLEGYGNDNPGANAHVR